MAEGGGTGDPEGAFPKEVLLDDDNPSSGYFTLTLTVPDLKAKSSGMMDKVYSVTNGSHKIQITEGEITITVSVEKDGKSKLYSYFKKLPVKIIEKKSKYKLKDDQVILILAKAEKSSLGQYETYFRKRPQP